MHVRWTMQILLKSFLLACVLLPFSACRIGSMGLTPPAPEEVTLPPETTAQATATQILLSSASSTAQVAECATLSLTGTDDNGALTAFGADLTIELTDNSNGSFFSDSSCSVATTTIAVAAGSTGTVVRFRGLVAETATLVASTANFPATSMDLLLLPGTPTKLGFSQTAGQIPAGTCRLYTIESQDAFSNPSPATARRDIVLTGEGTLRFFSQETCGGSGESTTTAVLFTGDMEVNIWVKDTTPGSPTIGAVAATYTSASIEPTIVPASIDQIVLSSDSSQRAAGNCTELTIETQDPFGNASAVTANTQIDLSHDGGEDGDFFSNDICTSSILFTTLNSNTSTKTVYFKSTRKQAELTLSASDEDGNFDVGEFVLEITPATASKYRLTGPSSLTANSCSAGYLIETLDDFNNAAPLAAGITVALAGSGTAQFFANASCAGGAVTTASMALGTKTKSFFMKDAASETVAISVSGGGLTASDEIAVSITASSGSLAFSTASALVAAGSCATYAVQTRNVSDVPTVVGSDLAVVLSGNGDGSFFDGAVCGGSAVTQVTVPSGSHTKTFSFRSSVAATLVFNAAATGYTNALQDVTVEAAAASVLTLSDSPTSSTAGTCVEYTITSKDASGNATAPGSPITVNLSDSGSGTFHTASSCLVGNLTTSLTHSTSTSTIYFKDTVAESTTLTAAATSYTSATEAATIVAAAPAVLSMSGPTGYFAGECAAYTVSLTDEFANTAVAGSGGIAVTPSSNKGGSFFTDSGCTVAVSSTFPIAQSASSTTVYFKDTVVETGVTLTVAATGLTSGSVSGIAVSGVSVANVTSSSANGTYTVGESITVEVVFTSTVTVTGTPQLTLETGSTDALVNYASGTGTNTLNFTYTVAANQVASDLDYASTSALALNGGTINGLAGNAATLTLASPGASGSLGANKSLVVDTGIPRVTNVTASTSNGTYGTGQTVSIEVVFDEAVSVTGTPRLTLETGATDAVVNYSSGTGTTTLVFVYTISSGHAASDLDYSSTSALALNGGTIKDASLNDASLTLASPGAATSLGANKAIVIDSASPTVTNVTSSTSNGTYVLGQSISIQVTFSRAVTVTGTPQLTLETGTSDAVVNYASGSGTTSLTFTYTIASGHASSDLDYSGTGALALNGGTIVDTFGNSASLTLVSPGAAGSLGANKALVLDTAVPVVTNVTSSTDNGTYGVGEVISIQVTFSAAVTVTGTPQLTLETGTSDAVVSYTSGSGTTSLSFNYTVASGHTSSDLAYVGTSSLALNFGTINSTSGGSPATLTLPSPGAAGSLNANKALVLDTGVPQVTSVTSSTANGTYTVGGAISIQVVFNEAVTVTGTPQLTLETGTTDAVVNYASGTGTTTLTFTYTVASGHASSDLEVQGTGALALNSGTIKDSANNDAVLTIPLAAGLSVNKNLVVDAIPATVTNVTSSTSNGSYGLDSAISIQVTFNRAVTVTGTPTLTLETGTSDAVVNYASGTGTTSLTFTYTVAADHASSDLDYVANSSLALNGGTILDSLLNAATLTLPEPGAAGSLGANKALVLTALSPNLSSTFTGGAAGDWAAFKVASAGDVNRDGKSDIIIGNPKAAGGGTERGTVVVISGADGSTLHTINGSENSALFGYAVGGIGDNNRDGYGDFMVGAPLANGSGTDRGKIFIYSGLTGSLLRTITHTVSYELVGYSLANAGDVNQDGTPDIISGAPYANGSGTYRGKVFVYSGATGSALTSVTGTVDSGLLGYSVSAAGDVNKDGKPDFMAGGTQLSSAYVYSGANAAVIWTLSPTVSYAGASFGYSVAGGKDLDGDGTPDFVVGYPTPVSSSISGIAMVFSGASGETLYTFTAPDDNAQFGSAVAVTGDIDGDGKADFIVGEPAAAPNGSASGKAYAYSGANGNLLFTISGSQSNAQLGYALAGAGDVNLDGKADIVVGAWGGGTIAGQAFVYTSPYTTAPSGDPSLAYAIEGMTAGVAAVSFVGDINLDGKSDFIVTDPAKSSQSGAAYVYSGDTGAILHTITGAETSAQLGFSAAGLGDTNGDGYPDFIVGIPYSNAAGAAGSQRGKAIVYSGKTGGVLHTISGTQTGETLGYSVSGVGDVNHDGEMDFVVGSPAWDASGGKLGKVVVYSGASGSVLFTFTSSTSAADSYFGLCLSEMGDANEDGYPDIAIGAIGRAAVYSGSTGTALYTISASLNSKIAGVGDVNGDGGADFAISRLGAPRVLVYSGATGTQLHDITLAVAGDTLPSVAGRGDINRDGKSDIVIGYPAATSGSVFVYDGSTAALLFSIEGSGANSLFGTSVSISGNANGDGQADLLFNDGDGKAYLYFSPAE